MRTPPPVVPPHEPPRLYKSRRADREGPDAHLRLRAAGFSVMVWVLTALMWHLLATRKLGLSGLPAALFALVAASLSATLVFYAALFATSAASAMARAFTLPSGTSTPYEEQFSYQDSLAARGDVAGALESFEAVIAEQPGAAVPRLKAAELYARRVSNPRRAAELYREVRDLPGASPRDTLHAALRLVDLYDGPLAEPGRALVELRRLVELYPDTDVARGARSAIARMKADRAAGPGEG